MFHKLKTKAKVLLLRLLQPLVRLEARLKADLQALEHRFEEWGI